MRCPFSTFLHLQGGHYCACAQKWCHFSYFPRPFKQKLFKGTWRDHCFPEQFSGFLHETGLEGLKITSARCFLLKCQRKDSKKVKEHRQFRGVLGRWGTVAIDRTTFHACQRCRIVFKVFSRLVNWRGIAFCEQQCQFLTRNKSLSRENQSNCSMTSECVRTDSIVPRGAGLEHGRCKQ